MRLLLLSIGWLSVGLGIIGIFLPIMPTAPFLILSAWIFSRTSPRFEAWLYQHRLFGPPLVAWRDGRVISRPAKIMAVSMMAVSFGFLALVIGPPLILLTVVGSIMAACAAFILTRNDKMPEDRWPDRRDP